MSIILDECNTFVLGSALNWNLNKLFLQNTFITKLFTQNYLKNVQQLCLYFSPNWLKILFSKGSVNIALPFHGSKFFYCSIVHYLRSFLWPSSPFKLICCLNIINKRKWAFLWPVKEFRCFTAAHFKWLFSDRKRY